MSRAFFLAFAAIFFAFILPAQSPDSAYRRAAAELGVNRVSPVRFTIPSSSPGHNVLVLEVPFAKPEFIPPALVAAANGKLIEKVQLVYTTFAVSASFDQQTLNRKRLQNLYSLLPSAFENPLTEWELVGQTGAHSPEEGRAFFHGFVITWRPDASPELVKREMEMLDSLFSARLTTPGSPGSGSGSEIPGGGAPAGGTSGSDSAHIATVKEFTMPDGKKVILERDIPEDSLWRYMKPSGPDYSVVYAKYGDSAHTVVIVTEMSEMGHKRKRTWKFEEHKGPLTLSSGFPPVSLHDPDSVVTSVMRRNTWENMLVVTDVTGSMSPYTAQIFAWLPNALATGKCAGFVFFNDGDQKKTPQKTVGKTGGIYGTSSVRSDSIYMAARKAMSGGDGGDQPENNVEAMIWAINNIPAGKDIVLIADNWATPRDLSLFEKVNRPVHIVLCGARGGVNPAYLFLARATRGTVHTVTDDVTNLADMQEGETVKVGFQTFLLNDGRFVPLENFGKH